MTLNTMRLEAEKAVRQHDRMIGRGHGCTKDSISIIAKYIYIHSTLAHRAHRRDRLLCSLCSRIAMLVRAPKAVSPSSVRKTPRRETM